MNPNPTMEDVARAAGVHQTTVSRALRNDRRLPESTRQRIKAIADEMGYRPNPLLSALGANLRQRRTSEFAATIAYLVQADDPAERRREHVAGATRAATEQGYRLEEFFIGGSGVPLERLNDILVARHVQGVIVGPLPVPRGGFSLRWEEYCAVAIEYTFAEPQFDRVVHDSFGGMRLAMQECRARGYRRPGLVLTEAAHVRTDGLNVGAHLLEQWSGGFDAVTPWITPAWSAEGFSEWFRVQQPDVILTSNVLLDAVSTAVAEVPGGVGLININARPDAAISGIEQASDLIGAIATQLVIDKINRNDRGPPRLARTILTPGRWHEGATVRGRR